MTTIIFESHATSLDNESKLCSGWNDVDVSKKGLQEAAELGERYGSKLPDVVFCSDLLRSYKTAALAFKNTGVPILIDDRLRECDYGTMTKSAKTLVEEHKMAHLTEPFPGGESYQQATTRMKHFLDDIRRAASGKTIMIIGHRATQYGLEVHINNKQLEAVVSEPWQWQPGWTYNLL